MCLWGGHTHVLLRNCGRRSIFAFRHCEQLCTPQRLSHSASVCVRVSVCVCVCKKTDWAVLLHGPIIMITHVVCKILHLHTHCLDKPMSNVCTAFCVTPLSFLFLQIVKNKQHAQNLKPFLVLQRIRKAILWILWKWLSTLFLLDLFLYVKRLF